MKGIVKYTSLILAGCLLVVSCKKNKEENELDDVDCSTISASYNANIKAITTANCVSSGCHNAGSSKGDFTTYAGLKAVADKGALESKVIKSNAMPPSTGLGIEDRKKIKCWLNSGAPNN